ncbi:MAG: ABC transporter substrate-binding protein [Bacillaceae bacterium]|nr:ABC transporter substrate-binding protein [Bacillaceae bacterium]
MDNQAWKITYPTYERLVAYDGDKTTVKPALAKDWEISDDGKTYTFFLNEGHKFADGTEVDAEAVKFSFERTLKIGKGPSGLYSIIDNIEVVDPYTVKFELKNAFPPFISTLAANYGAIVNPKVMEHEKDGDLGQGYLSANTMGSGPYQLEEYNKGQYYKLTVNPHSAVKPNIDTVYFRISSDVSETRISLEKGEIDIAEGIPADQLDEVGQMDGVKLVQKPSLLVDYVYMNIGKGTDALKSKEFRQGISHAIDYDSIINETMQGFASRFVGPVPEGLWGHNPDSKVYEYDVDKAKELIQASGFEGAELDLLYSDNKPYWEELALTIQSNLEQVGVKVNLTKVAYPTMREKIDIGEFDLCVGVWSPDYGDPYMFMNYWFDSDNWGLAGNRSFYANDEVDQLIRKAATISDQAEREELYKQAQEIINEEAVYIYIDQQQFTLPMSEDVKGFVYNPMLEGIYNLAEMTK